MQLLLVEDEPLAAERLMKMVTEILGENVRLEHLDSVASAKAYFAGGAAPDLILLDIHLADGSAFDLLEAVTVTAPIIFTTAYDEHAIQAFRVNAIDYLLKPIKRPELEKALDRWRRQTRQDRIDYRKLATVLRQSPPEKRFLIRVGQQIHLVEATDAAYFYTEDRVTLLTTFTGKRYPMDHSLDKLEEVLDPNQFFRINRQFIVNSQAIREMHTYSKSRVKLVLDPPADQETIVSTERSPNFKSWLVGED
jgi:two-component system LytT family response regulator